MYSSHLFALSLSNSNNFSNFCLFSSINSFLFHCIGGFFRQSSTWYVSHSQICHNIDFISYSFSLINFVSQFVCGKIILSGTSTIHSKNFLWTQWSIHNLLGVRISILFTFFLNFLTTQWCKFCFWWRNIWSGSNILSLFASLSIHHNDSGIIWCSEYFFFIIYYQIKKRLFSLLFSIHCKKE